MPRIAPITGMGAVIKRRRSGSVGQNGRAFIGHFQHPLGRNRNLTLIRPRQCLTVIDLVFGLEIRAAALAVVTHPHSAGGVQVSMYCAGIEIGTPHQRLPSWILSPRAVPNSLACRVTPQITDGLAAAPKGVGHVPGPAVP